MKVAEMLLAWLDDPDPWVRLRAAQLVFALGLGTR